MVLSLDEKNISYTIKSNRDICFYISIIKDFDLINHVIIFVCGHFKQS